MPDERIREVIEIGGDPRGGQDALKTVQSEMAATERKANSLSSRFAALGKSVVSSLRSSGQQAKALGSQILSGAQDFARGARDIVTRGVTVVRTLSAIAIGAGLAAGALGLMLAMKTNRMSDQFLALRRTWLDLTKSAFAPYLHAVANGLAEINGLLKDPAVVSFMRQLGLMAAVIVQAVIPAIKGLILAIISLITSLASLNFDGIWDRAASEFNRGATTVFADGGKAAGATFVQAAAQEIRRAGGAAMQRALARAAIEMGRLTGKKMDIGDLGTTFLNSILASFDSANFDVLQRATDGIRNKISALINQGQFEQIKVIPALIGSQIEVARALKDLNETGSLTEANIARVRAGLSSLGDDVTNLVIGLLQQAEATKKVEEAERKLTDATEDLTAAQAELKRESEELKVIQLELADAERRHTAALNEMAPELAEITQMQLDLAEAQLREIDALAKLEHLRDALVSAEGELAAAHALVIAAEDALIPLTEELGRRREELEAFNLSVAESEKALAAAAQSAADAYSNVQEEVNNARQARSEAIAAEQRSQDEAIRKEEAKIKAVDEAHAKEKGDLEEIIASVDRRFAKELEGRAKALKLAERLQNIEQQKFDEGSLVFAQRRAAAQNIKDANQRIAALAKINRAEREFQRRNEDGLEAANLALKIEQERLKTLQDKIEAEKGSAPETLANLLKTIDAEKEVINLRIASLKEEGAERVRMMTEQSRQIAEQEDQRLATAKEIAAQAKAAYDSQKALNDEERAKIQSRIDAAAADVEAQGKAIARLAREEEVASRKEAAARLTLEAAEKAATVESTSIQEKLTKAELEYNLRKQRLDLLATQEQAPIKARLDAAQVELETAQGVVDLRQIEVDKAGDVLEAAQLTFGEYSKTLEAVEKRLGFESLIGEELDAQRSILQSIGDINRDIAQDQAEIAADLAADRLGLGEVAGAGLMGGLLGAFDQAAVDKMKEKILNFFKSAFEGLKDLDISGFMDELWKKIDAWLKERGINLGEILKWGDIASFLFDAVGAALWVKMGLKAWELFQGGFKGAGAPTGAGGGLGGMLRNVATAATLGLESGGLAAAGWMALGLGVGAVVVTGFFEGLRALGVEHPSWETTRNLVKIGFETKIPEGIQDGMTALKERRFVTDLSGSVGAVIQEELDAMGKPHYFVFDKEGNLVQELLNPFNLTAEQLLNPQTGYIQTLTGGFNEDAANFEFDADGKIVGRLKDPFEVFKKDVTMPGGTWPSAWSNIQATAKTGLDDFKKNNPALQQQLIHPFQEAADEIVNKSIIPAMYAKIKLLSGTFKSDMKTFGTATGGLMETLVAPYAGTKESVVGTDGNKGIIGGLIDTVTGLFTRGKQEVTDPGSGTLAQMKTASDSRLDELKTSSDTKTVAIKDSMTAAFELARSTSSLSISNLSSDIQSALNGMVAPIGAALTLTAGAFDIVFKPKTGYIAMLLNGGQKPGGNELGGILPWMEWVINKELDWQRFETWQASFDETKSTITAFVGPGSKFRTDLEQFFTDLGKAIVAAFVKGMTDEAAKKALEAAGKSMVDDSKKGADDAAGNPESPAPAFIPLGTTFPQGLGKGMDLGTSVAVSAAKRVVSAIRNTVSSGLNTAMNMNFGSPGLLPALATAGIGIPERPGEDVRFGRSGSNFFIGTQHVHREIPATDLAGQEFMRIINGG